MSIRNRIEGFSPCYTFASSISTIACGISYAALEVAFSEEGKMLRRELMKKINLTIDELNKRGFVTNGIPSPIIPVLIGELRLTRLLSREIIRRGLIANLVEFPAVPRDKSIIRFQMMGGMSDELIIRSCDILKEAIEESQRILLEAKIDAINIAP
jgi:7-keto-8-aminopelargonate synthetase-like enzyme